MSMLSDLFTYDIVLARQRELLADADRMRIRAQVPRPRCPPPSALWRVFTWRITPRAAPPALSRRAPVFGQRSGARKDAARLSHP